MRKTHRRPLSEASISLGVSRWSAARSHSVGLRPPGGDGTMRDMDHRPWYRLHWFTWVVMLAVAAALVRVQWLGCSSADLWSIWFGWPLIAYEDRGLMRLAGTLQMLRSYEDARFHASGLFGDLSIALLVWLASAFMTERWLRRKATRLQFSVQSLLIVTMISGGMLAFVRLEASHFEQTRNPSDFLNSFNPGDSIVAGWPSTMLDRYPWYISLPLLFSAACTLYTAGWLLARIPRLSRRVFNRSHAQEQG